MITQCQSGGKLRQVALEHLLSFRIQFVECLRSANDMQRGALFRSGFGKCQCAVVKMKYRQNVFRSRGLGIFGSLETPRDHEVNNQPKVAIEPPYDAFADTAQGADFTVFECRRRGINGTQYKGASEFDSSQTTRDNARLERLDLHGDIG